jgi:hypothetical protein
MTDIAHRLRTEKPLCKLSKAAAERIEELERALVALAPFAYEADTWSDAGLDNDANMFVSQAKTGPYHRAEFSPSDLRRARDVYRAVGIGLTPPRPIPVLGTIGEDGEVKG